MKNNFLFVASFGLLCINTSITSNPLRSNITLAQQAICTVQKQSSIMYKSKTFGNIPCINHIAAAAYKAKDDGDIYRFIGLFKLSQTFQQNHAIRNHPYSEQIQHALVLGNKSLGMYLYDKGIKNTKQSK